MVNDNYPSRDAIISRILGYKKEWGGKNTMCDIGFIMDQLLLPEYSSIPYKFNLEKTREQIKQIIADLSPREQKILEMRFGIVNGKAHSLQEVGRAFGVTRERIRQIEARALEKVQSLISPSSPKGEKITK